MPLFSYKAIDEDGVMIRGTVESTDLGAARNNLSTKGFHIIRVKRSSEFISGFRKRVWAGRAKRVEVIEFSTNLSVMLRAGIPILSALEDMIGTTEEGALQGKLAGNIPEIKRMIEMGMGFSDALEAQKNVFPDILVRLARVGEETGRLDKTLSDVAAHLQRMEDLKAAVKRALLYPALVIVAVTGALIFWLAFVLPSIMALLKEMDVEMPLMTRILLHVSEFTEAYWPLILLIPAALLIGIQVMKKYERTRYYIDSIKLKIPIVNLFVTHKLLALFSEQLHILIVAGITIDRSFEIVSDAIGHSVFQRAITASKNGITSGSSISNSLKEQNIFPHLVVRLVNVGETTGTLDEQFAFLSEYYRKKVDGLTANLEKMIEPLLIGAVGGVFAFILIGLMGPVYDAVSRIGAG
jgi:type II secretory pathway component PulF